MLLLCFAEQRPTIDNWCDWEKVSWKSFIFIGL
jgi:hypothetical protein